MSGRLVGILGLLSAPLVSGCGDSPTAPVDLAPKLEMSVELASSSVPSGGRLNFTIRVVNLGTKAGSLAFTSGCMTTFRVSDAGGVVYDDATRIRLCTAEAVMLEIAPGESRTWSEVWDLQTASGPLAPGRYRLAVDLLSAPALKSAEAEFEITP